MRVDDDHQTKPAFVEGCWVRTRDIRAGDEVQVDVDFLSDDASPVTLHSGLRGCIQLIDGDGDTIINFLGLSTVDSPERFVLRRHLRKLKVWRHEGCTQEDSTFSGSEDGSVSLDEEDSACADESHEAGHAGFFRSLYRQSGLLLPWDIGQPQPDVIALQSEKPELFMSPMLDVGAGFGDNSIWLATSLGLKVTACDISADALAEARRRQAAKVKLMGNHGRGGSLNFLECNILNEPPSQELIAEGPFAAALDSAAFHCIGGEEDQRRYVRALAALVQPMGYLIMLASSDRRAEAIDDPRLRRVSQQELHAAFCTESGWHIQQIQECRYCMVGPSVRGLPPQRIATPAWLMVARRLKD